jgi:hypothetical protein
MQRPGRVMLQRAVRLAAATAARLEAMLLSPSAPTAGPGVPAAASDQWRQLLSPPPLGTTLDVVLHLRRDADLLQDLACV